MKKVLTASGVNGEFMGLVEVVLNAEFRTKIIHNRGTHDEEEIRYSVHKIKGVAVGKEMPPFETEHEDKVVELADSMEKQVMHLLQWQADLVKKPSLNEILKDKGYE